jgi:hypothetical protein
MFLRLAKLRKNRINFAHSVRPALVPRAAYVSPKR